MTNFEMANYIVRILQGSGAIFMSWGSHSFVAINQGLQFKVSGFKHKGLVQVVYNEGSDLFEVRFLTTKNKMLKTLTDVYIDQLSELIDDFVEKTNDYDASVAKWLNKTKF